MSDPHQITDTPEDFNPYTPPTAPPLLENAEPRYRGIGRVLFILAGGITLYAAFYLDSKVSSPHGGILSWIRNSLFFVPLLYPLALRMKNVGLPLWYLLIFLIPMANFLFLAITSLYLAIAPPGYVQHGKLDRPATAILWLLALLVLLTLMTAF